MIGDSKLLGLDDRVRVRLVTKRLKKDQANSKMERMKKRNIGELGWADRKDEMKFEEMVENLSKVAVGDSMEHMLLEEMMNSLGLGDRLEVGDVGPWEVEWLVQCLTMQDRLGLGPAKGDVYMKEVPGSVCAMIPEVEEWMWMA